jgi:hypothetical protein
MRRALNILLVIIGISASVMASPRQLASTSGSSVGTEADRLHVSLPADMKDFPIGAIPLP